MSAPAVNEGRGEGGCKQQLLMCRDVDGGLTSLEETRTGEANKTESI